MTSALGGFHFSVVDINARALGGKTLIVPINVPTNLYWYQMESNLFFSHGERFLTFSGFDFSFFNV